VSILVEVVSGAIVNGGGVAEVGNGVVAIQANGVDESVTFLSGGTGGLELADTASNPDAYGGTVSGFGQNTHQYIDLTGVASGASVILGYSASTSSSGVLTVSSGGTAVATIDMSGQYTTANFHVTSGIGGTVKIYDPSSPAMRRRLLPPTPAPRSARPIPAKSSSTRSGLSRAQSRAS
jgi:hypothetical protein